MKKETTRHSGGRRELWGMALITLAVLLLLALFSYHWQDISVLQAPPNRPPLNFIGPAGAWCSFILLMAFGLAAFLLPVLLAILGFVLLFRSQAGLLRYYWLPAMLLAVGGLLAMHAGQWEQWGRHFNIQGLPGGLCGELIVGRGLEKILGRIGATVLLSGVLLAGFLMLIGKQGLLKILRAMMSAQARLRQKVQARLAARRDRLEALDLEERRLLREISRKEKEIKKAQKQQEESRTVMPEPSQPQPENLFPVVEAVPVPPPPRRREPPKAAVVQADSALREELPLAAVVDESYQLPPLSILQELPTSKERSIKSDVQTTARVIAETLAEFSIQCEIKNIVEGPVVTRYELLPAAGVRVERIGQLSNTLALTLKAQSVRVQAPIPGKGLVGIEVPNTMATKVYLREIMEGEQWQSCRAAIPLILGKDVGGADLIADLATMPHLLIAGATGSGKTVCMNSILAGLLMRRKPSELKMILVDPKIVEFSVYKDIPHLLVPVITEAKKVAFGLRWAIIEMERRYKLFARAGVRNIQSFNARNPEPADSAAGNPGEQNLPASLPYVVIIIDELADLMMVAQADVETSIARLAQLSRAVGIHLILATQRPSVNVITGTIKANFPARISFQVSQQVDSRTILDGPGAEKLLGRGDMLIMPPGASKLVRAQGAMTSDEDIRKIVEFIKQQSRPDYVQELKDKIENPAVSAALEDDGVDDDLLQMAIAIVRESRKASVSHLQRRLRIGYNRAGRVMDKMEDMGIVGPARGSEPREILIDLDGDIPHQDPSTEENC